MAFHLLPIKLRQKIRRHRPVMWAINSVAILVCVFLFFTILHKYIEDSTWEIAFWMSWETFSTVGYGDHPAQSTNGRVMTMLFGTLSIMIMSAVIGIIVALVDYLLMRRRKGMVNNSFSDGYVLMHFPGTHHVITFINEIREKEPDAGICIVDSSLEELPVEIQNLDKIHFLRSGMLKLDTYRKANLKDNKSIIIFPKDSHDVESDGITKVLVDLVSTYVQNKIKILYVLVDEGNSHMFEDVLATRVLGHLEILSIVQECKDETSAPIIEQLLRNTNGADPNTVKPVKIIGWTWREFMRCCIDTVSCSVNPLALIRSGNIWLCPDNDEFIQSGDMISVVAPKEFNWSVIESELEDIHSNK